ncbi:LCP family protein [Mesobacillus foraminis]|uniref:LytR family transcriptional attenuator n=1 Tax=Mesobacillus foraminis TaxID=279826 RepID=A0A4R2BI44_9BACI|nr:LCP family protein [Mesobacillus foraminis]TCN26731.1 LytR family transcriptional attenuator [Mesobacillus foraminis]
MSENRRANLHHPKKKKRKRIVRWILMPLLLITVTVGAYGAHLYSKAESVINKSYQPIDREGKRANVNPFEENISVLFIGVDDSQKRKLEGNTRTDAMMLATFNKDDKSVKLLSIPRDSYVYIPGQDVYTKINHAHAYGGVEMTLDTVENLLDVPVDYYVKMNFNAFMDVIDALNGIEVDVPVTFTEQDSKDKAGAITLEKGLQTLNGEEALALARTRKIDNDIERGKRQQLIIKAIISKAASAKSVANYTDVMEAIGENMSTDLRFNEMVSFIDYATAGNKLSTETLNLAGADSRINGIYYYQLDEAALAQTKLELQTHLGLAETTTEADSVTTPETGTTTDTGITTDPATTETTPSY